MRHLFTQWDQMLNTASVIMPDPATNEEFKLDKWHLLTRTSCN